MPVQNHKRAILFLFLFLAFGCGPKSRGVVSGVFSKETPSHVRHRRDSVLEQIRDGLKLLPASQKIEITSLLDGKGYLREDVVFLKKEIRGLLKPGKITEEPAETAGTLRDIIKHLLAKSWIQDAIIFKNLGLGAIKLKDVGGTK